MSAQPGRQNAAMKPTRQVESTLWAASLCAVQEYFSDPGVETMGSAARVKLDELLFLRRCVFFSGVSLAADREPCRLLKSYLARLPFRIDLRQPLQLRQVELSRAQRLLRASLAHHALPFVLHRTSACAAESPGTAHR